MEKKLRIIISHQAATLICRRELNCKIPAMDETYLLATGAKLGCYMGVYIIYGYSGDDMLPYLKYAK